MYLSEVRLVHWRSYHDATFKFPKPDSQRPLVLVGAMNGHGKTSFLLGLYFGMFGRFATRFAEGFQVGGEEITTYKKALREFRRRGVYFTEPTEIHITLSPSKSDPTDTPEFRIERRWYFSSVGKLRDTDGEQVTVYVDGKPRPMTSLDDAHDLLEDLFPAHALPAFFFDGEQAQRRIEESGDKEMRRAVEVLYGTRLLEDLRDKLGTYLDNRKREVAAPRGQDESQLDVLRAERDHIEKRLAAIAQRAAELEKQRQDELRRFDDAKGQLKRLGLSEAKAIERSATRLQVARTRKETSDRLISQLAADLGLPMALRRLADDVLNRLDGERKREDWDALRQGTRERTGSVLDKAFPSPDPLLSVLSDDQMRSLRDRFQMAIESIYEPPPDGCAAEYRFGHVRTESRQLLQARINDSLEHAVGEVRTIVKESRDARDELSDAERQHSRFENISTEAERLGKIIEDAQKRLSECDTELNSAHKEETAQAEARKQKKAEIGRLETDIKRMAPAQQRIELVTRIREVLQDFSAQLAPLALRRLEEAVTRHFVAMADQRFDSGLISFDNEGMPLLTVGEQAVPVRTMSGYERRTFGIAFSLALAEVSGFRAPLVIDTPLGNADSAYRLKLLKHIVEADVDQIIILTHDEEVVRDYYYAVSSRVAKEYLVQYDQLGTNGGESCIHENRYFPGKY